MRVRLSLLLAALVFMLPLAIGLPARADAQTALPLKYNATAINMGDARANAGRVFIEIERWSTPDERKNLLNVLAQKGPENLLDTLQRAKKTGYVKLPNTLAWDLRYAFESPLPEGGRRVVLATDRPIGMQEARSNRRTMDYPFTLIEIRFDRNGVGTGKMSVYTKIDMSKDKQTLQLENYDIEPVRLTEVRIDK
jgi:hypothetical protein